jgi:glycosyltransferase involved in cell wall biosynthesis
MICSLAYNVERYIEECAASVMNQTFTDFEWVILDNGSTDQTGNILRTLAESDHRITIFTSEKNSYNNGLPINPDFMNYVSNPKAEYWCSLDTDDFLHHDFLQELYTAAKRNDADIAVGGTEMFMEGNRMIKGERCPPDILINEIKEFGEILPEIYGSFRAIWGKLFKASVIREQREFRLANPLTLNHAGDTLFCLDCLRFTNSVVAVNKVLHYYRLRDNSYYHSQVDPNRHMDYLTIYLETIKLLEAWSKKSESNLSFISQVLYSSMNDCMKVAALNQEASIESRLTMVEGIISNPHVMGIIESNNLYGNLINDANDVYKTIVEKLSSDELLLVTDSYYYRLYRSLDLLNQSSLNRQEAFLLFISALCDSKNINKFGLFILPKFLKVVNKNGLAVFFDNNKSLNKFLVKNPDVFRFILHLESESLNEVCKQNKGNKEYDSLNKQLPLERNPVDHNIVQTAKQLIESHISSGNNKSATELINEILNHYPLDQETLMNKLYLLAINGERLKSVEVANALETFYQEDENVLLMVGQAYIFAGLNNKARAVYQRALEICNDPQKQKELKKELEAI